MNRLIQQIEQWAEDRNLIKGSTPQKQMLKLMEEFGELCGGIAKNKPEVIKDSIGDCFVVLVIMSNQIFYDFSVYEAITIGCKTKEESDHSFDEMLNVDQLLVISSLGDLSRALATISDDIDTVLYRVIASLTMLSIELNMDLKDCIQHAYDQIKDRKGKMIDGVFVKEEDLCN